MNRKEKEELILIYQESLSMEEGRSFEDFLVSIILGYRKAFEMLSEEKEHELRNATDLLNDCGYKLIDGVWQDMG